MRMDAYLFACESVPWLALGAENAGVPRRAALPACRVGAGVLEWAAEDDPGAVRARRAPPRHHLQSRCTLDARQPFARRAARRRLPAGPSQVLWHTLHHVTTVPARVVKSRRAHANCPGWICDLVGVAFSALAAVLRDGVPVARHAAVRTTQQIRLVPSRADGAALAGGGILACHTQAATCAPIRWLLPAVAVLAGVATSGRVLSVVPALADAL